MESGQARISIGISAMQSAGSQALESVYARLIAAVVHTLAGNDHVHGWLYLIVNC